MKPAQQPSGRSAFDLIEEATHLLRTAPAATLATYYLGAIPFALGLLYFWADMSRSPFAPQHLADATLGLTALFLWMKFWQTVFARHLRARLAAEPPPVLSFRRCARIFLSQTIWQPLGLFLIPLALIPLIPFAWIYVFFQNVTALADGDPATKLIKKSWQQARLWPRQNHFALLILSGFGFYVFLNWITVGYLLPQLAKILFGISSIFTESPGSLLNTTFFTGIAALTYLCVDPILKAYCVLRCFYGESLQSGEDLKAELKTEQHRLASPAQKMAVLLVLIFALTGTVTHAADVAPASAPASQIAPADLDHVINQTIHERKFTWRMPREQVVDNDADNGLFSRFLIKTGNMLRDWGQALNDWWHVLWKKLFPPKQVVYSPAHESSGYGWIMSLQIFLYALFAIALAALGVFLYRLWIGRQTPQTVASVAIQPVPDLTDENIRADQLPEDGWTKLARELLERGEFRLALRAFYLASLAHLAARNLIHIARFKSNRDYERELRRRGHTLPQLLAVFGDNVSLFERIWYGTHTADRELVDQFAGNVEKIKVAA